MSMKWYAVQAFSGFDKSVQKGLEERVVRSGLQDQFGQILVPIEEVIEMKNGQKTISERKLYPGYVLVQMSMTDESWHLVKSNAICPSVHISFFGVGIEHVTHLIGN